MDINEISSLLDDLPVGRSSYEFQNFFLEQHLTPSRQLVEVMKEMERLHSQIIELECAINPNSRFGIDDTDEDNTILIRRELNIAKQNRQQLADWYDAISADDRAALLANYEQEESEFWTNRLGRETAIDLLTKGRSSAEVMNLMSLLPQEDFERAVRICTRYARLIRDITSIAESSVTTSSSGLA